jgi:aspartate-semialdehyde dehydrogenase
MRNKTAASVSVKNKHIHEHVKILLNLTFCISVVESQSSHRENDDVLQLIDSINPQVKLLYYSQQKTVSDPDPFSQMIMAYSFITYYTAALCRCI